MIELEYIQKDDYLFPNIVMEQPQGDIGKYGRLRLTFLKEHHEEVYSGLLLSGKLWEHLVDINEQVKARAEQLVSEIAAQRGINESLKAQDQMEWVGRMNNVIAAAEEIVLHELIYCQTE